MYWFLNLQKTIFIKHFKIRGRKAIGLLISKKGDLQLKPLKSLACYSPDTWDAFTKEALGRL
jgi:hypothetical protein